MLHLVNATRGDLDNTWLMLHAVTGKNPKPGILLNTGNNHYKGIAIS